jgi:hypothetical protein
MNHCYNEKIKEDVMGGGGGTRNAYKIFSIFYNSLL